MDYSIPKLIFWIIRIIIIIYPILPTVQVQNWMNTLVSFWQNKHITSKNNVAFISVVLYKTAWFSDLKN